MNRLIGPAGAAHRWNCSFVPITRDRTQAHTTEGSSSSFPYENCFILTNRVMVGFIPKRPRPATAPTCFGKVSQHAVVAGSRLAVERAEIVVNVDLSQLPPFATDQGLAVRTLARNTQSLTGTSALIRQ
jgi:hypothetical protein